MASGDLECPLDFWLYTLRAGSSTLVPQCRAAVDPNTPLFLNLVNELRIRVLEGKVLTIRSLKRLPRLKRFGKKFVRFLVWGRPLTGTQEGKGR